MGFSHNITVAQFLHPHQKWLSFPSSGATMTMKKHKQRKKTWQWCPVCMSNQYFEERGGVLICTNKMHRNRLLWRKDEWVKSIPEWQTSQKPY
jgi:hypothetical protein